jgi:hypothetical protein
LKEDDLATLTAEAISQLLKTQYARLDQNTSPNTNLDEDLWEVPGTPETQEDGEADQDEAIQVRVQTTGGQEEEEIQDVIYAAGLGYSAQPDDSSESSDLTSLSGFSEISDFDQSDDTDYPDASPMGKDGGTAGRGPGSDSRTPAVFFTQHQKLPIRPAPWKNAFLAGTRAEVVGTLEGSPIDKNQRDRLQRRLPPEKRCFTEDEEEAGDQMDNDDGASDGGTSSRDGSPVISSQEEVARLVQSRQIFRIHRSRLPPPPKWHTELNGAGESRPWSQRKKPGKLHPFGRLFEEAEVEHLRSHHEMRSWIEAPSTEAKGHQLLDCMWVYVYKFNKHGFFRKCKARLVVRGDQQAPDGQTDTYAATLAGRSFRALIAIATRFDL